MIKNRKGFELVSKIYIDMAKQESIPLWAQHLYSNQRKPEWFQNELIQQNQQKDCEEEKICENSARHQMHPKPAWVRQLTSKNTLSCENYR
jgi:hypothetical protein